MRGFGTILNVLTIIIGSSLGLFLKGGLPKRFEKTLMSGVGLAVLIIGLTGTLPEMFTVSADGTISSKNVMLMVLSVVIGAVAGETINIEDKLEKLGMWFRKKALFLVKDNPKFVDGFVSASLLFCVGAMAIVGSISDGLTGDFTTLAAKSVLDGVTSVVMSASLDGGVIVSAVVVGIYQGMITLLAALLQSVLTDELISQMTMVGSILIMGIGFNLLFDKKIVKVGNLLPAVLIPVFYQIILNLIG